ncbi:sensor histidine kinase [Cohnella sp.]|uniref:sensor histidine kinase n=1 Tax=Cohnella sp. TaxID=1883426 RepID=UPI003561FBB3
MFYTLRSKMMFTFSLLLVVPFLSMVLIFTEQSKDNVEQIIKSSSAQTLEQYAGYLDMLSKQVEDITFQVLGNQFVQQWIEVRSGTNASLSQVERYELNLRVKDFIAQVVLSQSNVASISLHDRQGFVIGNDSVYENVKYDSEDWYAYVKEKGPSWLSSHTDMYQPNHLSRKPINSLLFPLVDLETLSIQGAIKVNISSSLIKQPLSKIGLNDWSSVQLVNSSGITITEMGNTRSSLLEYGEQWELMLNSSKTKDVVQLKDEEGSVRYWFYRKLDVQDWLLVGEVTEKELFQDINKTSRTMLSIGVGLLLLTIIAAYWISSGMTRPLSKLSQAMRRLEMGDFNAADKLDIPKKGEAGYLLYVFARMVNQLNQLIRDEFTLKLRKQDAEYKALLMQVNPHFLYNTLEVIGSLAAQNKTEQLIDVTESLGQMLRNSLKLDTDIVTLSAEMQQIRYYMDIIKCRFEEGISFELTEDPSLANVPIIKFILQPLVENAVKYSKERMRHAVIHISASRRDNRLVLTVEDNGQGMSEQQVSEIIRDAHTQDAASVLGSPGRRIGLRNVLARCRLYYGEKFEVEIESKAGKGMKISILLPISEGTNHV